MNSLKRLESQFKKRLIKKPDYIKKMHQLHSVLWHYFDFIQNRNIDSIEISQKQILFTTRDGIKIIGDAARQDERLIPLEILNFGDHEAQELKMIRRFLKKDSIILDIGTNIGWYVLNLAKNVPQGKIIAFEPMPQTFEYLKQNVKLNNIKNVKLYNFGLGDKTGGRVFYYYPTEAGSTSLKDLHDEIKKIRIKCPVKRLDDFIDRLTSKIHFIKCDVEGAELSVIKGGLKTIQKHQPVLFLEMLRKWSAKFNYHPNQIIKILDSVGYECYYIKGDKLIKIKKIDEKTKATNFFFIHCSKVESSA